MTVEEAPTTQPQWLTSDEMETWRALHLLLAILPGELGRQLERDSNLSFIEYYTLAVLSEQPDRTMRLSHLAVLAYSELSRLSHLMKRLEKRGLVRREPDPTDGRFTVAVLTEAGYAEVVQAAPGHVAHVRQRIFDVLSPDEQHALRNAARKVTTWFTDEC
ncbi:MarR family winged helix-turn-helix transcriptional regulator [Smaragdicoccus niigatensis]|uniref:MarR family winged helix-turn-helix transcriptional regulator n=1 Tax=Smaragdicoccus niigatensis TaxID=359359 RepID=UPI000381B6D5|nr:MarR family transcriptional regulator [Smaragdicoccus niigatensis]